MNPLPRGPVMLGVEGFELTPADIARLSHPSVGGVILFARNYESPEQLQRLTTAIHALRDPPLLIAVDHEGGRVQRFRNGFTVLPPMRAIGEQYNVDPWAAVRAARQIGWTLASELRSRGVDFSFAPVADVDYGVSSVIGDRAFHRDPVIVATLAVALRRGLNAGGCAAVAKHFPGHGFVSADSHTSLPVDERALAALLEADLQPFEALIADGLEAVMPAHVVYPQVDHHPAGFSPRWIRDILRGRLDFDGLVFSDDLEMAGAHGAGDILARAQTAMEAGCDAVLACNDFAGMETLIDRFRPPADPQFARRSSSMQGRVIGPVPF